MAPDGCLEWAVEVRHFLLGVYSVYPGFPVLVSCDLNEPCAPAIFTVRLFLSGDLLSVARFLADLPGYWLASFMWPGVIIALAFSAPRRCSSDRMCFRDGLLWVTASMMTGWVYMSFLTVWPELLVVFWGSIVVAIYGDLNRAPGYSQARWHRLVSYFYRNRMRQ
jgi:hypothetical protein